MTANLRVVADEPAAVDPIGAHMAEMVHLWAELTATGPELASCYGIVFGSYTTGRIEASFQEPAPFLAWAEHLGLAVNSERFGGTSVLLSATGVVKRNGRSAHVQIRCATKDRGAA